MTEDERCAEYDPTCGGCVAGLNPWHSHKSTPASRSSQSEAAVATERDAWVRIDLPLPLDMAGTITNLIGLAYSGAMIDFSTGSGRQLVIRVPEGDRRTAKKVTKKAAGEARLEASDAATEGSLTLWDAEGHVNVALPEEMGKSFASALAAYLEDHPEAPNYMEWSLRDPQENHDYIVYVCRSPKQTPHELRAQAEAERDAALARLAELEPTP